MSREPYDPQQHQIITLEGIEHQLERIADTLERKYPPRSDDDDKIVGDFGSVPGFIIPKIDRTKLG